MKLGLLIFTMLSGSLAMAEMRSSDPGSMYGISTVKAADSTCAVKDLKRVFSADGKIILRLCKPEYKRCAFEGACIVENSQGERVTLSYERFNTEKNRSEFTKVTYKNCSYGLGSGRLNETKAGNACLIPYVSVSADALEYKLGDVIFVPGLVGVTLPTGTTHDGYLIVGDYAALDLGTGDATFALFTGAEHQPQFIKDLNLFDEEHSFKFEKVSGEEAAKIRKDKGFRVLETSNKKFELPKNPMLDPQQ